MPIDWLLLSAAAASGLLGAVHCAAMCGGIATGLSAAVRPGNWQFAVLLNLGRISAYALAGAAVGAVGQGALWLARSEELRLALRMVVGGLLIAVALRGLFPAVGWAWMARPGAWLWARLAPLARRLQGRRSAPAVFALGMLWGWLPCGLSTSFLMLAWLQGDALNGALLMLAFGSATLVTMLPLTLAGVRLSALLTRKAWRRGAAAVILFSGGLMISAPWLMHLPGLHGSLSDLACFDAGRLR